MTGVGAQDFKAMSVDELLEVKSRVEQAIAVKIDMERKKLRNSLHKLDMLAAQQAKPGRRNAQNSAKINRRVKPRYRNPLNPTQTWAGRGLKPRWLVDALRDKTKKLTDFAIDN